MSVRGPAEVGHQQPEQPASPRLHLRQGPREPPPRWGLGDHACGDLGAPAAGRHLPRGRQRAVESTTFGKTFYNFLLSTTTANATNKIQIKVISIKCEVQQVGRWKPIKCSSSKAFRSSQSTDERGLTQRANSSPRRGRIRGSLRRSKRRPHWTTSTSSFTS